jgi:hypothetical protein
MSPRQDGLAPEAGTGKNTHLMLRDLAHARAGDKGSISDITVVARRPADYALLREQVTAGRVAAHFAGIVGGPVDRYELPCWRWS